MAGLYSPIKLSPSSLSLLLLSLLPLSLAAFAFILQWKYDFGDPTFKRPSPNHLEYMDATTSFNCVDTLGQSGSISFPYIRDFRFNYKSDLKPKPIFSRMWNETFMSSYFYKPCNHELYVKQYLNMEMAIVMAREAHMDWILHLDTDELIYPAGTPEYSLRQLLSDVPENVDMVVFPNYESCVERDDVEEPFTEVSMFKKNFDHLMEETYFRNYRESIHGNPNYFLTYANGKSAARVQQHLRPNGAHRWHNHMKTPNMGEFSEAAVLHYTYAKFSDLTSRRDRCGCKPTEKEVEKCFFLEFDRAAFIIASSATEEEMLNWYRKHVVWSDKDLNKKLMKEGILTRIYDPMVIMQGLKETGVYSSLIKTVQTSRSEDMFLSSNEVISNSPKSVDGSSSAKIGKREHQMTICNVLQPTDTDLLAMPPLPSPVMDGIDHHHI